MPPRRRLDSLTTPREPRYNLRPRSRLVQSGSNDNVVRDIQIYLVPHNDRRILVSILELEVLYHVVVTSHPRVRMTLCH